LDARATGVVDSDDRAAGLESKIHDLDDLLAEDLTEGSAEHGEVLGEHTDRSAVDGAVPGDHTVAVGPVLLQPEGVGPVACQSVDLLERVIVEQLQDPLHRGHLALGVLLVDRRLTPTLRLFAAQLQIGSLADGRGQVDLLGLGVRGHAHDTSWWECLHYGL